MIAHKIELVLISLFAAVSVGDILTTIYALQCGGRELNPVINFIANNTLLLIVVKVLAIVCIIAMINYIDKLSNGDTATFINWINKYYLNVSILMLSLAVGITLGAVVNNLIQLKVSGLI